MLDGELTEARGPGRDGPGDPAVRPPAALLVPARPARSAGSTPPPPDLVDGRACGCSRGRAAMIGGTCEFTKGHGTGNDFVILPDPDGELDAAPPSWSRRSATGAAASAATACCGWCAAGAASRGGGARRGEAEWFMDYWNADGSIAEMCGNGVRVFARYLLDNGLVDRRGRRAGGDPGRAGAGRGRRADDDRGGHAPAAAGVRRRAARLGGSTLRRDRPSTSATRTWSARCRRARAGPARPDRAPGCDPAVFPAGVNVEFVAAGDAGRRHRPHVRMRVYERGSGETLSCGTGACAVAAVALRDAGRDSGVVAVDVPGGRLTVTLDDGCWLAGPAVLVATASSTRRPSLHRSPPSRPAPAPVRAAGGCCTAGDRGGDESRQRAGRRGGRGGDLGARSAGPESAAGGGSAPGPRPGRPRPPPAPPGRRTRSARSPSALSLSSPTTSAIARAAASAISSVNSWALRVQHAAEHARERQHVVDLVGLVGAAGRDHRGVLAGLPRVDLGVRVGQREDDRVRRPSRRCRRR